jgi:Na+/H+-dicarboxylate symporter
MRVIIGWLLWLTPLGIFAFSFVAASNLGWNSVGILGAWVGIATVLALLLMAGLYLTAVLLGRVSLTSFAKALLPAQEVGLATRSSLAALPALLEGAQAHLKRNDAVSNVVLPLGVSSFKLNRTINSVARLLFLAYVYNVPLGVANVTAFAVAAMLMSFTSPGIPARGPSATLPLYLAAGIPLEGIVLTRSVDSITDFAMTVLNVTADMTAMTVVGRLSREPAAETSLEPVPSADL